MEERALEARRLLGGPVGVRTTLGLRFISLNEATVVVWRGLAGVRPWSRHNPTTREAQVACSGETGRCSSSDECAKCGPLRSDAWWSCNIERVRRLECQARLSTNVSEHSRCEPGVPRLISRRLSQYESERYEAVNVVRIRYCITACWRICQLLTSQN